MYPYGLIGNCQCSALVSDAGSVDWLCFPRPDSPPVFGAILDPQGGRFSIAPEEEDCRGVQAYLPNTNVLETRFRQKDGSEFRILDFCPRFIQYGRKFKPLSLFRIVEPMTGHPRVRVVVQPVGGWDRQPLARSTGSNHLLYERGGDALRLHTDMSLTYLTEAAAFTLREPRYFAVTFNSNLEEELGPLARDFLRRTSQYWEAWVMQCRIPTRHQKEVIRSGLALKLHCFEDTGAVLAALSCSLPEQPGQQRNWDYRFCWLRDAYFSLGAFHKLGHSEEAEGFLTFLLDLGERHVDALGPVYRLDQTLPLPEETHFQWAGYAGSQPVRSGNQAAEHVQNDVYGEMLLTLAPLFQDERFRGLRQRSHEELLGLLAKRCLHFLGKPDAGLWEMRDGWKDHSFSNLMHWAGLDRALKLQQLGFLKGLDMDLGGARARAEAHLQQAAKDGILRSSPGLPDLDASLLLLPMLHFPNLPLCQQTVSAIRTGLAAGGPKEGFLYRYKHADDFGRPASAFVVCSFWLVQALATLGKLSDARAVMSEALTAANSLGLLSEHFDPLQRKQWGNFPQAYSHVGLIHAAFAVSEPWDEVL